MSMSQADIEWFIAALHEDASLRERVRAVVLTEDWLTLPQRIAEAHAEHVRRMDELDERIRELDARLAARMDALDERVREMDARLTARIEALTERTDALTVRMDALTQRMDELTARMDELTQRMDELTQRMDVLTQRMDELTQRVDAFVASTEQHFNRIEGRLGNLEGWRYESQYRDNLIAHLVRWMRKGRRVFASDLDDAFDAYQAGKITPDEWDDVHRIDVLAMGERLDGPGNVIFAIELPLTVDVSDVERAQRRSEILQRAGIAARAAVDGERITGEARTLAEALGVLVLVAAPADRDAA